MLSMVLEVVQLQQRVRLVHRLLFTRLHLAWPAAAAPLITASVCFHEDDGLDRPDGDMLASGYAAPPLYDLLDSKEEAMDGARGVLNSTMAADSVNGQLRVWKNSMVGCALW